MASKKSEKSEKNGALVFEKMGSDFVIPARSRSGDYKDFLIELQKTKEVVAVYHAGPVAKGANSRRKSLMQAAAALGIEVRAAVRTQKADDGTVDNVLYAQMAE